MNLSNSELRAIALIKRQIREIIMPEMNSVEGIELCEEIHRRLNAINSYVDVVIK